MLQAHNFALKGPASEADTGKFPTIHQGTSCFHIVCLECGATGALRLSKDGNGEELVGFTSLAARNQEGQRLLICNSCGQSDYELVREGFEMTGGTYESP